MDGAEYAGWCRYFSSTASGDTETHRLLRMVLTAMYRMAGAKNIEPEMFDPYRPAKAEQPLNPADLLREAIEEKAAETDNVK